MLGSRFSDDMAKLTINWHNSYRNVVVRGNVCTDSGQMILPFVLNVVADLRTQSISDCTVLLQNIAGEMMESEDGQCTVNSIIGAIQNLTSRSKGESREELQAYSPHKVMLCSKCSEKEEVESEWVLVGENPT